MDEECYCMRCHRRLKSERSIKAGLGPTCRVKRAEEEFLRNQMTIFDFLGGEVHGLGQGKQSENSESFHSV